MGDRQDTDSSHVNYKVKPHPEVRVNSVQDPANLDRSNYPGPTPMVPGTKAGPNGSGQQNHTSGSVP